MQADYPDSHYHRQLAPLPALPPLAGAERADVCVVGGGLAGLSVAYDLAGAGMEVCVVEARRIGWGASGRNGGFVSAGFALGLEALLARVGRDHARALAAVSTRGLALVRERVTRHAPDAAPVEGMLLAWRHPAGEAVQAHAELAAELLGHRPEAWSRERVRDALRSERYFEALHDATALHLQPLAYCMGMARAVTERGARLYESSAALGLRRAGEEWRVSCTGGEVRARHVVLAGSAELGRVEPRLARAVLPVATYMMCTEPLGARLRDAIRTDMAIGDTRGAGDYYRARDGRILWGGRMTTRTTAPVRLKGLLRADLLSVYPQLGDVAIDSAWSGLMGYARHRMPLVGRLETGLWHATAFGGHGLNTTAAVGELIARAIAHGDDEYRLFAPFTREWTGGPLGRVAAQASYWRLQLGDRLRERAVPAAGRD